MALLQHAATEENPLDRYMRDTDQRTPGYYGAFTASRAPVQSEPPRQVTFQRLPARQNSSYTASSYTSSASSSRPYSDAGSWISTPSTISTAPTDHPTQHAELPQLGINASLDHGIRLPCEFACVDCHYDFPLDQVDAWISHSQSHFAPYNPPTKAICTICDDDTAVFENETDPIWNWENRMTHIRDHFVELRSSAGVRPDFWVIEYLRQIGRISPEDYAHAKEYDERPPMEFVHPLGYQPPEKVQREYRESQTRHDLAKEEREIRRHKGKGKSSRGSSRRYNVEIL